MRRPRSVVIVTSLVLCTVIFPAVAAADPATTLYVNNTSGANCSDSGAGTQTQPYCTVQAAADVVNPGQTVDITGNYYEPVTITRSGTAAQPLETGILPASAAMVTWLVTPVVRSRQ